MSKIVSCVPSADFHITRGKGVHPVWLRRALQKSQAAVIRGEGALENASWKLCLRTVFMSKNTLKLQTVCVSLLLQLFCENDDNKTAFIF